MRLLVVADVMCRLAATVAAEIAVRLGRSDQAEVVVGVEVVVAVVEVVVAVVEVVVAVVEVAAAGVNPVVQFCCPAVALKPCFQVPVRLQTRSASQRCCASWRLSLAGQHHGQLHSGCALCRCPSLEVKESDSFSHRCGEGRPPSAATRF